MRTLTKATLHLLCFDCNNSGWLKTFYRLCGHVNVMVCHWLILQHYHKQLQILADMSWCLSANYVSRSYFSYLFLVAVFYQVQSPNHPPLHVHLYMKHTVSCIGAICYILINLVVIKYSFDCMHCHCYKQDLEFVFVFKSCALWLLNTTIICWDKRLWMCVWMKRLYEDWECLYTVCWDTWT